MTLGRVRWPRESVRKGRSHGLGSGAGNYVGGLDRSVIEVVHGERAFRFGTQVLGPTSGTYVRDRIRGRVGAGWGLGSAPVRRGGRVGGRRRVQVRAGLSRWRVVDLGSPSPRTTMAAETEPGRVASSRNTARPRRSSEGSRGRSGSAIVGVGAVWLGSDAAGSTGEAAVAPRGLVVGRTETGNRGGFAFSVTTSTGNHEHGWRWVWVQRGVWVWRVSGCRGGGDEAGEQVGELVPPGQLFGAGKVAAARGLEGVDVGA